MVNSRMARFQSALGDFLFYFAIPYAAATGVFTLLVWLRNPTRFDQNWTIGLIAGGVIGVFALAGFVAHRRKIQVEPWRDML